MRLDPEQKRIVDLIRKRAQAKGARPIQVKAALETGLVESNLRNLAGGDADSAGWRQERASLYKNPTNLRASIDRFFDETKPLVGKYGRAGDLAAAVQRPAAQYRGRYQEMSSRAQALLGAGGSPATPGRRTTTTTSGPSVVEQRSSVLGGYLATRGQPGALLGLGVGLGNIQTPTSTTTTVPGQAQPTGGGLDKFVSRANAIDAKQMPYLWGGGHGGKVDAYKATPLDCSGAVAAVLGIDPRVSGQFKNFGKPGEGGRNNVTIYANDTHVLMKVGNRFFGTSGTNPGGGAGWVPKSSISRDYLKRFTARHL